MAFHVYVYLLVVFLILCLALLWHLCWFPRRPSSSSGRAKRSTLHRLFKPRTPRDCPACCLSSSVSAGAGPSPGPVRPWSEVKSRRGARHPHRHRRVRLSQPAVPVLRDHRCSDPRGFSAMASMGVLSGSKRSAVRPATAPSVPDATPRCTG